MWNPKLANCGVVSIGLVALLLMLGEGPMAIGAEQGGAPGLQVTATAFGIGGQAKVGYWTPVRITIKTGSKPFRRGWIELIAPDGDGVPTRFRRFDNDRLLIAAGTTWSGWFYVKVGRVRAALRLRVHTEDGAVVLTVPLQRVQLTSATRPWVVVVGTDVGIKEAANRLARQQQEKLLISHVTEVDELPDRWYGYEAVDVLLCSTADSRIIEQMSQRQFAALRRWVEMGGRLVLSVGKRAAQLFGPEGRLAEFSPGEYQEMDPYWKATGLEAFARSSTRLLNPDQVPIAVFANPRGKVLAYEGVIGGNDHALVWRYPFGFGEITYLAFDLERPPLSQWAGRSRLVARLLEREEEYEKAGDERGGLGQVTHVGFKDLAGQLRGCLEQFPGITLVRFSWIAGLLVGYLLLIGPVDYYLLRKLGRPQWTWFTFPLLVLLFCAVAMFLARDWQGHQVLANQVDLVDVDMVRARVRGTTWGNLYSPYAIAADVRLTPTAGVDVARTPCVQMSWQGLPGTGLGGMDTTGTVGQLNDRYRIYTENQVAAEHNWFIDALPVLPSSTKPFIARWWAPARSLQPSRLTTGVDGFLHGEVVNPLSVELEHAALYFGNWSYRLDRRLAPGDRVSLEAIPPLDLRWQLTRRQLSNSKSRGMPWDRTNFKDVPRIMEMMMFHGAAGGRRFTGLTDRYQGFADLSNHLRTGRAILVGWSSDAATHLEVREERNLADHVRHWTFYRVVMPVKYVAMK